MKRLFVASLAALFVATLGFASMAVGPEVNPGYEFRILEVFEEYKINDHIEWKR